MSRQPRNQEQQKEKRKLLPHVSCSQLKLHWTRTTDARWVTTRRLNRGSNHSNPFAHKLNANRPPDPNRQLEQIRYSWMVMFPKIAPASCDFESGTKHCTLDEDEQEGEAYIIVEQTETIVSWQT